MITEKIVEDVMGRFFGQDVEFTIRRSHGGFSKPSGYTLTIYFENRGSEEQFFHDNNTVRSLKSKMIDFAEYCGF